MKISYNKNTGSAIEDLLKIAQEEKYKEEENIKTHIEPSFSLSKTTDKSVVSTEFNFSARELRYLREIDSIIQKSLNGRSEGIVKQSRVWAKSGFSEVTWRKYVKILIDIGRYKILESSPKGTIFSANSSISL
jgi:hypothetical protein